jgi:hypothetical protein
VRYTIRPLDAPPVTMSAQEIAPKLSAARAQHWAARNGWKTSWTCINALSMSCTSSRSFCTAEIFRQLKD